MTVENFTLSKLVETARRRKELIPKLNSRTERVSNGIEILERRGHDLDAAIEASEAFPAASAKFAEASSLFAHVERAHQEGLVVPSEFEDAQRIIGQEKETYEEERKRFDSSIDQVRRIFPERKKKTPVTDETIESPQEAISRFRPTVPAGVVLTGKGRLLLDALDGSDPEAVVPEEELIASMTERLAESGEGEIPIALKDTAYRTRKELHPFKKDIGIYRDGKEHYWYVSDLEEVSKEQRAEVVPLLSDVEIAWVASTCPELPDDLRRALRPFRQGLGQLFAGKTREEVRAVKSEIAQRAREILSSDSAEGVWSILKSVKEQKALESAVVFLYERYQVEQREALQARQTEASEENPETQESVVQNVEATTEQISFKIAAKDAQWLQHISSLIGKLPQNGDRNNGNGPKKLDSHTVVTLLSMPAGAFMEAVRELFGKSVARIGHHPQLTRDQAVKAAYYLKWGKSQRIDRASMDELFDPAYQWIMSQREQETQE